MKFLRLPLPCWMLNGSIVVLCMGISATIAVACTVIAAASWRGQGVNLVSFDACLYLLHRNERLNEPALVARVADGAIQAIAEIRSRMDIDDDTGLAARAAMQKINLALKKP